LARSALSGGGRYSEAIPDFSARSEEARVSTEIDEADRIDRQRAATAKREIQRHARVYIAEGLVATVDEFQQRFGWRPELIAQDLLRRGCGCCNRESLGSWLSVLRLGLNVIDAARPPSYPANVEVLCPGCLREMRGTRERQTRWRSYCARWKANLLLRQAAPTKPI
jgi:hypothetical protein